MTLKELLDRCDFKDIAPIIADMSPECKSALPHYKETFDILRHLTPKERAEIPEDIRQWICPYIRFFPRIDPETGERTAPFGAFDCEGDAWDECLSREIVVSDELTLNDNEIVAHCLWSLTFYGFNQHTEEGVEETFHYVTGGRYLNDNWQNWRNRIKHYKSVRLFSLKRHAITRKTEHTNPYEVAAKNLEEKINRHNSSKENRSKRMRKRRQERHFKKLVRMARVENAIRSLTRDTQSFSREELKYLFDTALIYQCTYQSYSYSLPQRMDYLFDLYSNYVSEDFSQYTRFLLMFRTSSDYPLVESELGKMQNFFKQCLPASACIRYGYGNDETLGTEVSLLFLGSY